MDKLKKIMFSSSEYFFFRRKVSLGQYFAQNPIEIFRLSISKFFLLANDCKALFFCRES